MIFPITGGGRDVICPGFFQSILCTFLFTIVSTLLTAASSSLLEWGHAFYSSLYIHSISWVGSHVVRLIASERKKNWKTKKKKKLISSFFQNEAPKGRVTALCRSCCSVRMFPIILQTKWFSNQPFLVIKIPQSGVRQDEIIFAAAQLSGQV